MMKTLLTTTLTAAVLAMVSVGAVQMTNTKMPLLVGHRGASADAPENTLASFKLGLKQGADGVESDFWLTSDGKIACTHDESFKRCGGVDRKVGDMTLAEVQAIDIGKWKGEQFAGEHPPTLAQIFSAVTAGGTGKLFFLEIKCGGEIVPELKKEIDDAQFPLNQIRFISFQEDAIKAVKDQWPDAKAYWLTDFKKKGDKKPTIALDQVVATLKACHATGIDCHANLDIVNESFVKTMRDNGWEFHAWTVDDPAVAKQLIELGVDSITTNKPGMMRAALVATPEK